MISNGPTAFVKGSFLSHNIVDLVEKVNYKSWQVNDLGPLNVRAFPQVKSSLLRCCCRLASYFDILLSLEICKV